MNREIVLKAIQKGQSRGLNPSQVVDLIEDYLELLGDPVPVANTTDVIINRGSESVTVKAEEPIDTESDNGYIELSASPKKRLNTPAKEWVAENLFDEICKYDWSFAALPEGFTTPLDYRGTPVLNPRGMKGVGVIFTCVDVANPKELPLFFPLSELKINPKERMEEVKRGVESLLRVRKTPVAVNFNAITTPPAIPSFEPTTDGTATAGVM